MQPDNTPARLYLARRRCWPPKGIGPDLPPDVRWHETKGLLVCAYRDVQGDITAVSVEALKPDGHPPTERWRRTYGSRKGSCFRPVPRPEAARVALVEGELDALAGTWLYPDADVLAVGGTSGIKNWEPWDKRPLCVYPDGDSGGDNAARALQSRPPRRCWRETGRRPAWSHNYSAGATAELGAVKRYL